MLVSQYFYKKVERRRAFTQISNILFNTCPLYQLADDPLSTGMVPVILMETIVAIAVLVFVTIPVTLVMAFTMVRWTEKTNIQSTLSQAFVF